MCENKTQQMLIRMSPYEAGLLAYISEQAKLSRAEILRLGLRIIARGVNPIEVGALQNFYAAQKGGENE